MRRTCPVFKSRVTLNNVNDFGVNDSCDIKQFLELFINQKTNYCATENLKIKSAKMEETKSGKSGTRIYGNGELQKLP